MSVCVCVCVCVCRWPHLRTSTWAASTKRKQVLDDFHAVQGDPQWVTLIDQKIKPVSILMVPSPHSWAPNCFSSALAQSELRSLSPAHVWTLIIPHCAHSFVILTADALHLNSSSTLPRGLHQGFWFFCVCVFCFVLFWVFFFTSGTPQI